MKKIFIVFLIISTLSFSNEFLPSDKRLVEQILQMNYDHNYKTNKNANLKEKIFSMSLDIATNKKNAKSILYSEEFKSMIRLTIKLTQIDLDKYRSELTKEQITITQSSIDYLKKILND